MSVLYIVRHAQATFLSGDYDQLSEKGYEQSRLLGRYWRKSGIEIGEVYSGSLKRQLQTAQACGETYASDGRCWPEVQILDGLNEYDSDVVMDKLKRELMTKHEHVRKLYHDHAAARKVRERYRTFQKLLEAVMRYHIAGDYESTGFETWREFHHRVNEAYRTIRNGKGHGRRVAVFTSGGPVGVSIQTCLQAPEQQAGELNWRVYNASITRFTFRADRISLDQFNTMPHLSFEMQTYR